MFPSETSLIPAFISLISLLEKEGLIVFNSNYPYWYLGTTPFKYLVGPVVPVLEIFIHKIFNFVSLFDITIYIIIFGLIIGFGGWLMLTRRILQTSNLDKLTINIWSACFVILYFVSPWKYLSAFALGNGTITVAQGVLPWILLGIWKYLINKNKVWLICAIGLVILLLLVDTNILLSLFVGSISLALTVSLKDDRFKKVERNIKRVIFILLIGILGSTFWYGVGYWLTILGNPSIGGASGLKVIGRVFNLLMYTVPLIMAFGAVYFNRSLKKRIYVFSLVCLLTFIFLSLYRFIGDPDFWMDWTAWMVEVEVMTAVIISFVAVEAVVNKKISLRKILVSIILLIIPITSFVIAKKSINKLLISRHVPLGVESLYNLSEIAGESRVFLSGTTVFWANCLTDLNQVRGGKDNVSKDDSWAKAAYLLREGNDLGLMKQELTRLGIKYVLVHTEDSAEYYHDFKNIDVWSKLGENIWQENGDMIFKINTSK